MVLFVALQIGDAASTVLALRKGAVERIFTTRWLIARIGLVPALALSKSALVVMFIVIIDRTGVAYSLAGACAVYIAVLVNNIRVLRRL